MSPSFRVIKQRQTAARYKVACSEIFGLLIVTIAGLGFLQRVPAADKTLPNQSLTSTPAKLHSKQVASYGKVPLGFEPNHGQTDTTVQYVSRGAGYCIFLTSDGAVLELNKSSGANGQKKESGIRRQAPENGSVRSTTDSGLLTTNSIFKMELVGANARPFVTGADKLPGKSNYLIGSDPRKWRTNVPNFARVKYKNVYAGIDLIYYGNQRQLEYDFSLAPGANPNAIKMSVEAVRESPFAISGSGHQSPQQKSVHRKAALQIGPDGDLVIKSDGSELRFHKPVAYQLTINNSHETSTLKRPIEGSYVLQADNQVGFKIGSYDHTQPLIIDPVLSYSTFLGDSGGDFANGIAVDSSGSAYVTGETASADFPVVNPLQGSCANCSLASDTGIDAFVSKLSPDGSALVYSTFLGGNGGDSGTAVAVDAAGNAYVTGATTSTNFPVTPGAFQTTLPASTCGIESAPQPCEHIFVAKLNADGSSLDYSTYLGGNGPDFVYGVAVDSSGSAYVTGTTQSSNFPTVNPIQTGVGFFVTKFNPTGSALVYSTTLGGSAVLQGSTSTAGISASGIAVDSSGNAYVTGGTYTSDFPVTPGAFQTTSEAVCGNAPGPIPCPKVFVFKLNAAGSALIYSTYLDGNGDDYSYGVAVDSSGNAYVAGSTGSTEFPTVNPVQEINYGGGDAFVAKLNATGSALLYSTYLGGTGDDEAYSIAVDPSGNAYVTGYTNSLDFPVVNAIQPTCTGCYGEIGSGAVFVASLDATGSALRYSTYLGGGGEDDQTNTLFQEGKSIAADSAGNAYVAGAVTSPEFITANPLQATLHGPWNAFVAKISSNATGPWVSLSTLSLMFGSQTVGTATLPLTESITNNGTANLTFSSVSIDGSNASEFNLGSDTCTGATVVPNGACTVSVTFTPAARGSASASLNFADNAPNSPQTVNMTGAGGTTFPIASLSTSNLAFGSLNLQSPSLVLPVTLNNSGTAPLTITNITTSANFSENDNCAGGVAAGGSCLISVAFFPFAIGSLTGNLIITDNSHGVEGNQQSVALSGTGVGQSFSLALASGSSGSATVTPGQSATYTLALAGQGGGNLNVTFACNDVPTNATCLVSPNPTTAGSTPGNVSVTVTTTAASISAPRFGSFPRARPEGLLFNGLFALMVALTAVAWTLMRRKQRGGRQWQFAIIPLTLGLLFILALPGCGGTVSGGGNGGGGGGTPPPTTVGTPAGTYQLMVTGTSVIGNAGFSHYVVLNLKVN